jgi:hypothetical protein
MLSFNCFTSEFCAAKNVQEPNGGSAIPTRRRSSSAVIGRNGYTHADLSQPCWRAPPSRMATTWTLSKLSNLLLVAYWVAASVSCTSPTCSMSRCHANIARCSPLPYIDWISTGTPAYVRHCSTPSCTRSIRQSDHGGRRARELTQTCLLQWFRVV